MMVFGLKNKLEDSKVAREIVEVRSDRLRKDERLVKLANEASRTIPDLNKAGKEECGFPKWKRKRRRFLGTQVPYPAT